MDRPKFSIGSWAFSFGPFEKKPWTFQEFIAYASESGYDGIEINGFHPHPHPDIYNTRRKCLELKKEIEGYGLGISGYAPDFRGVPPAEAEMKEHLKLISKTLSFCNNMDIEMLRVDTISPPDDLNTKEYNTRFKRLAKTWRESAEMCQKAAVKLVWEFEPGFWLNKPSEIKAIVDAVDHENFGVLFDTSHAYMCAVVGARQNKVKETLPGGILELADSLKGSIEHFHLIDSDGTLHDNETSTHTPFGKGFIDFKKTLIGMKNEVEHLKWWCFDFCFCPTTEVDGKNAISYVENVLKQIS
ncbi:MAG: sugar phosphate isomerase/epimerase [Flavobacteriaceae bacterium]|nr:sugar phosphate isomerase/epimerase [Flavobacteriaceae bacterium]